MSLQRKPDKEKIGQLTKAIREDAIPSSPTILAGHGQEAEARRSEQLCERLVGILDQASAGLPRRPTDESADGHQYLQLEKLRSGSLLQTFQ